MDTRRCLLVDAFTDEPLSGNAAGVVPDANGLTETQMQAIARELSVSETAFIFASDQADRCVRYFTPTQEVDLCGHATIASHAHLFEDGVVDPGTHSLETNVGVLDIETAEDGTVWMTQREPSIEKLKIGSEELSAALGIGREAIEEIGEELPVARSSTGLAFLIVPVAFLSPLGAATPDMDAIEALSDRLDVAGIYAFTFDTLRADSTLHGRAFAPGSGIPEDPVTGTASGACGAYLERFGALDSFAEDLQFEQGHFVDRPGRVRVQIRTDDTTGGTTVRVGGRAVTALDGSIAIPPLDADEIIEA